MMTTLHLRIAAMLAIYYLAFTAASAADLQGMAPSSANDTIWFFTPRAWLTNFSDKRYGGDVEASQSFFMPVGGATISVKPQGWKTIVDLTALYGAANGASFSDANIFSGDVFQGTIKASRLDLEALAHIPFGSDWCSEGAGTVWRETASGAKTDTATCRSWASVNFGARFVNGFSNITGLDSINLPFQFQERNNYYIAEVGVTASTPGLFSDDRQKIFVALNFGAGYKQTKDFNICCSGLTSVSTARSGGVVAADGFLAYQIRFGDALVSTRFRFQVISQGGFNLSQPTFIYGPEITFTLPFHLSDK